MGSYVPSTQAQREQMLRAVGLTERELSVLGVAHAGE